eukprot:TRINITY_DN23159_c0_g2_i1.p1 TRINITY_DN23159_c0_g2~~TRINITY_DN23159_c0_g2_i1.p1  ORF type:complete len:686 (+),score=65.27 TRINITY_DN23159_c0_g2_i1:30-2060(+)
MHIFLLLVAAAAFSEFDDPPCTLSEDPLFDESLKFGDVKWRPLPDSWIQWGRSASVDWRWRNVTTPIKKQCGGTCGTYALLEDAESQYALKTGNLTEFSDGQLLTCSLSGKGHPYDIIEDGLIPEGMYPCMQFPCGAESTAAKRGCSSAGWPNKSFPPPYCGFKPADAWKGWTAYLSTPNSASEGGGEEIIAAWVARNGPVQTAILSNIFPQADEQHFVTAEKCHPQWLPGHTNHAVNIVGVGTHPTKGPYFIIRNSWGPIQDAGYIYVARDATCGYCCSSARILTFGDPDAYWPSGPPPAPSARKEEVEVEDQPLLPPGPCMLGSDSIAGSGLEVGAQRCNVSAAPHQAWQVPPNRSFGPVRLRAEPSMCLGIRRLGGTLPSTCQSTQNTCWLAPALDRPTDRYPNMRFPTKHAAACCYACQSEPLGRCKLWTLNASICTLHGAGAFENVQCAGGLAGTRAPKAAPRVPSYTELSVVVLACDGSKDQLWRHSKEGRLVHQSDGLCLEMTQCASLAPGGKAHACDGMRYGLAECSRGSILTYSEETGVLGIARLQTASLSRTSVVAACNASTFEKDVDYHDGQGLGHAPGTSAASCCEQCTRFPGCRFFTFAPSTSGQGNGTCWFKANNHGRRSMAGCVSGATGVPAPPVPPKPPSPPSTCLGVCYHTDFGLTLVV